MPAAHTSNFIAIDVGDKRIGVATASAQARLASPLSVINNDAKVIKNLKSLILAESAKVLVIGLPRGLDGQDTEQTKKVRSFASELKKQLDVKIHFQDEALTSEQARQELKNNKISYNKGAVDALAATYILSDFLAENSDSN